MDEKKTLLAILLLALCLVVFQGFFKPPISNDAVDKLKSHFQFQGRYLGTYAPDFEVKSLDGKTFRLSRQLGTNVIVLNFFTTWCGPCQSEMDEFEYFVKKTKDMHVVFLAINVGEDRAQGQLDLQGAAGATLLGAEVEAVEHGAADQPPLDVAAALVGGQDAVGDEERDGTDVIRDAAHAAVHVQRPRVVVHVERVHDRIDDGRENVDLEVREVDAGTIYAAYIG